MDRPFGEVHRATMYVGRLRDRTFTTGIFTILAIACHQAVQQRARSVKWLELVPSSLIENARLRM